MMHRKIPRRLAATMIVLCAALWNAPPAAACRCPQAPMETYFERADVVLVGRVDRITDRSEDRGVTIEATPQFRQRRPFKGSLDGVTLRTPLSSASCGVPVEVGGIYVIFAHIDPSFGSVQFDSCSGSRPYIGGRDVEHGGMGFVGLPDNRVVPRLFELAAALESQSQDQQPLAAPGTVAPALFHTSPACWPAPRILHTGTPPEEMRQRVSLSWSRRAGEPGTRDQVSPNGAYRLWVDQPEAMSVPHPALVLADVELPRLLRIELTDVAGPIRAEWISEKLIFLRVPWGRGAASDLIVDVEHGVPIYEEATRDGAETLHYFRQACAGQCPCRPASPAPQTLPHAPIPQAADGEPSADSLGGLTYLDRDWDGRVFSEPGGSTFVRSAIHDPHGRQEYVFDLQQVRSINGGWWLEVAIYETSPCTDQHAAPAHSGWVAAYSENGRLVASAYPLGC